TKYHPALAESYSNLALIYKDLGRLEKALEYQWKGIKIYEKVFDGPNLALAISYINLSSIYQGLENPEAALNHQKKGLKMLKETNGEASPYLATSYDMLAGLYQALGKLEAALEYQLKGVEISEKVYEENQPALATAYNNLARIYKELGNPEKALEFQLKDVQVLEIIPEKNHPDLAASYNGLATIYSDMKDYASAREYFEKAVAILRVRYPNGHHDLNAYIRNLEIVNEMLDLSLNFGYVMRIELENIRAFKNLEIDLTTGGPRMLSVIIGRNGTCKNTLLRCIALGLCKESDARVLISDSGGQLVSEGAAEGTIMLGLANVRGEELGKIKLVIQNKAGRDILLERTGPDVDFFACGYGTGRGNTGKSQERGYRVMDSVATLFDYNRKLVDSELMLRRLEDDLGTSRYERAINGIKRVLGLGDKHSIYYAKGGGVRIAGPGIGRDIPLEAWADGYRMTFNWLIDLYGWAVQADAVTRTGGIRGILLVDEIDEHLHPSMQSVLLQELGQALENMQIFATTHSPVT
ncbi:MAG: tetratricopeptide repeat protein, partial [bacterium]|nr:tetratricopeptide repeat protein [bacterium]